MTKVLHTCNLITSKIILIYAAFFTAWLPICHPQNIDIKTMTKNLTYIHIFFKETRFSSCPLTFLIQFVHHGQYNFMLVTSKVPSVLLLLTLLVGQQEGHPACKKTERWGAGVDICLERGADLHMPSWCHCYSLSLASVKSRLVLPFWYRPTQVVLEKGQLNRCECVLLPPNHLSPAS